MSALDPSLATLAELRQSLGLSEPDPARVEISGADAVLPTRFRVGEAAAAALAACGSRRRPSGSNGEEAASACAWTC